VANQRLRRKGRPKVVAAADAAGSAADGVLPKDVAQRPNRFLQGLRWLAGGSLLLGASLGLAWGAHHYALTTPRFALTDLSLQGQRRLTKEELLDLSGIRLGQNLLSFEPQAVEAALVKSPWVESARVVRRLPGTLNVELVEREARAKAWLGEKFFLVSEKGEPFKEMLPGDPEDLPVISGISLAELARDRRAEVGRLGQAIDLLNEYAHTSLGAELEAEELHWQDDGTVVLTVGKTGLALYLGGAPWKKKLLRATASVAQSRAQGAMPAALFLDNEAHPERVVVRAR
jgi:cell division protein FtsQ